MTKAEWKKAIFSGLVTELQAHIDGGAVWLFEDKDGEPLTKAEEGRMRAAVQEVQDEFRRRGQGRQTPNVE